MKVNVDWSEWYVPILCDKIEGITVEAELPAALARDWDNARRAFWKQDARLRKALKKRGIE